MPAAPTAADVPGGGDLALCASVVVCSLLYIVPILGAGRAIQCYRIALGSVLVLTGLTLWRRWPKTFATLKDPAFFQSPDFGFLMVCFLLQMSPPLPFVLMPHVAYGAFHLVRALGPDRIGRVPFGFVRERATWLGSDEGIQMVLAFGALSEIMVALFTPVTLVVHGARGIAVSFVYGQYLTKRYKTSWWTRTSIVALDEKAQGLMRHRYCPAIVTKAYEKIKSAVVAYANR
uniref:Uncharacterized protein n=1 Tax=Chrysotila carterae TaxID=13221 RepID=A0A7S4F3V7_CHRCT